MVIDKNINTYVVYSILKDEGYDFIEQKKIIKENVNSITETDYETMITGVIIQRPTFKMRHIGREILEEMNVIGFTKIQSLRILNRYIKKYNLKKYYTKTTEWHIDGENAYPYHTYLLNTENISNEMFKLAITDSYCDYAPLPYKKMSGSLASDITDALQNITHLEKSIMYGYQSHIMKRFWTKKSDRAFTIKNNGDMTYTPKGKKLFINDGVWKKNNRIKIKYGKGIRKIFEPILDIMPDKVTEQICNHLKAKYTFDYKLEIVEGEDIKFWYHEINTSKANTGTLSQSCMRYDKCQKYFDIYTDNPKNIQMLIAIDSNEKLHGRALLWNQLINTKDSSSFKAMDRIYGNDMVIERFKEWGLDHGYAVKKRQSYQDQKLIAPNGMIITNYQTGELNNNNSYYPYMDTLKYTDNIEDNTIILSATEGAISLESTDGYTNDEELVTLHCGDRVHEDDACYDEINDEYYHRDMSTWCEEDQTYCYEDDVLVVCYPGEENQYYHPESSLIIYSEYYSEYIIKNRALYSEYQETYLWEDDTEICAINGCIHLDLSREIVITSDDTDNRSIHGTYYVHEDVQLDELIRHLE